MDLTLVLTVVRPFVRQLLAWAVTSSEAKTLLAQILGDIKSLVDSADAKASGPFKPLDDDLTKAFDGALGGVITALNA